MTDNGLPSWTAPSGRTYPPPPRSFTPPILPNAFTRPDGEDDRDAPGVVDKGGARESLTGVDQGAAGTSYKPSSNPSGRPAAEPDDEPDDEPPWLHSKPKPDSTEEGHRPKDD